MGKIIKCLALILISAMVVSSLSLLMVKPASAETATLAPMPSVPVPQFTVTPLIGGSVELLIKNQPFNYSDVQSYYQFNFSNPSVYYNIRIKYHNETDDWAELYNAENGLLAQSNFSYTIISIAVPPDAQTDIQVDAMIGIITRVFNPQATSQIEMYPYVFEGLTSDWSNTQTATMPLSSTSPALTSTVPELSWLAILPLLLCVFLVTLAFRHRKPLI